MLDTRTQLAVVVYLLTALTAAPAAAQDPGADYDPARQVVVMGGVWLHELGPTASASAIYQTPLGEQESSTLWEGQGRISDLRISPAGGLVAVREHIHLPEIGKPTANFTWHSVDETGQRVAHHDLYNDILRVIAPDGEEKAAVDFVYRYSWSPDGQAIALLRGDPYEGGMGYTNTSVWVLDIAANRLKKVLEGGLDLEWARFDGNLYIQDFDLENGVHRYVPGDGTIETTPYLGIHFSPGGGFYYQPSYEGTRFRLFQRMTNEEITADSAILDRFPLGILQPRAWLDEKRLVIPSPTTGETLDYVYDPVLDQCWEIEGRVIDLLEGADALVLRADGITTEEIGGPVEEK